MGFFFFFSARYLGFGIFLRSRYLGLEGSQIFGEKKNKKQNPPLARQGHIERMCQMLGSISPKRLGHWDLCAVKCENHGLAS